MIRSLRTYLGTRSSGPAPPCGGPGEPVSTLALVSWSAASQPYVRIGRGDWQRRRNLRWRNLSRPDRLPDPDPPSWKGSSRGENNKTDVMRPENCVLAGRGGSSSAGNSRPVLKCFRHVRDTNFLHFLQLSPSPYRRACYPGAADKGGGNWIVIDCRRGCKFFDWPPIPSRLSIIFKKSFLVTPSRF